MQGNDLSNRLPPRWLFVYEGVVARLREGDVARFRRAARTRRWRAAVDCWETEPRTSRVLWDLVWRRDYRFDLVTFLGRDFADALERRLAAESLPFSNLHAMTPDALVASLTRWPDVAMVVHGDPSRLLAYGPRGMLVTDPDRLEIF